MTNDNQTYYKLVFPRDCSTNYITLMEQRRLESNEYHAQYSRDYFPIIVFQEKNLCIQESPLLEEEPYKIYQKEVDYTYFRKSNNRDFDSFLYDDKKGIVVYGNIYIYLIKKEGKFYEVVTGEEVPSHSFLKANEIHFSTEFDDMIKHLTLIKAHQEVYHNMVTSIFKKYEEEYISYINAQERYREQLNKLLKNPNLEVLNSVSSVNNDAIQKEKIKNLIDSFKK